MTDETIKTAPDRIEQLESIIRELAKQPDTQWYYSDSRLADLIRRSRELTQKDKP